MLPEKTVPAALHAIHRILVHGRWMAYHDAPSKQMAELLDAAEILPTLIASDEDETVFFQLMLEGLAEQFPACRGILEEYLQTAGAVSTTESSRQAREELRKVLAARDQKITPALEAANMPKRSVATTK